VAEGGEVKVRIEISGDFGHYNNPQPTAEAVIKTLSDNAKDITAPLRKLGYGIWQVSSIGVER
jgi:hypothetical protein